MYVDLEFLLCVCMCVYVYIVPIYVVDREGRYNFLVHLPTTGMSSAQRGRIPKRSPYNITRVTDNEVDIYRRLDRTYRYELLCKACIVHIQTQEIRCYIVQIIPPRYTRWSSRSLRRKNLLALTYVYN